MDNNNQIDAILEQYLNRRGEKDRIEGERIPLGKTLLLRREYYSLTSDYNFPHTPCENNYDRFKEDSNRLIIKIINNIPDLIQDERFSLNEKFTNGTPLWQFILVDMQCQDPTILKALLPRVDLNEPYVNRSSADNRPQWATVGRPVRENLADNPKRFFRKQEIFKYLLEYNKPLGEISLDTICKIFSPSQPVAAPIIETMVASLPPVASTVQPLPLREDPVISSEDVASVASNSDVSVQYSYTGSSMSRSNSDMSLNSLASVSSQSTNRSVRPRIELQNLPRSRSNSLDRKSVV